MRTRLHVQTIWDFALPPPHPLNDTRVVARGPASNLVTLVAGYSALSPSFAFR